ncbi:MAG: hypothetical protein HRU19_19755 [Pseudobacteriovorax sp.]|nr:hypothetical protein [Pseudobacteriovorax sp.]
MKLKSYYTFCTLVTMGVLLPAHLGFGNGGPNPASAVVQLPGEGYDLERNLIRTACLNGSVVQSGSAEGKLSLFSTMSLRDVARSLNVQLDGSFTKAAFKIDGKSSFVKNAQNSMRSLSYNYASEFSLPNDRFVLDPNQSFNTIGKAAKHLGLDEFRRRCGDRFVQQRIKGGGLFFTVKMQFEKATDKLKFEAEVGSNISAFNLATETSIAINKLNINGQLSINVLQLGGEVSELGQIIGTGGANAGAIATCSFDNIDSCQRLITELADYASDEFPSQFQRPQPKAAILGYEYQDYGVVGVGPFKSLLTPEVRRLRKLVSDRLMILANDINRAQALLFMPEVKTSVAKSQSVKQFIRDAQFNTRELNIAGISCFEFPKACKMSVDRASRNLLPLDTAALVNSQRLSTQIDKNGILEIAVFEREAPMALPGHFDFEIEVPDDYIVIGGGGAGTNAPFGHLLVASYPGSQLGSWFISSKDHAGFQNPFKIKGYAVGLKVNGLMRNELAQYVSLSQNKSTIDLIPEISTWTNSDQVILGGGLRPGNPSQLLISSYPVSEHEWSAKTKAHFYFDYGDIETFAIGIDREIPHLGTIEQFITESQSNIVAHPTTTTRLPHNKDFLLAGCGVDVGDNPLGNLVYEIRPLTESGQKACRVSSKDHGASSPAAITGYALGIKLNKR